MLPKIVELAKKEMKLPARIGLPKGITGLDEDPSLSTVAGLVLEATDSNNEKGRPAQIFSSGFGQKLKKVFKVFIP